MGTINSFQSMGSVDGPGLRYVIFMQGCPLRCIYCHNPETWELKGESKSGMTLGTEYSVEEIIEKILRYKTYFGEKGGVTVSGGEPLLQWRFVAELFRILQQAGIHTALDTSGAGDLSGAEAVLKYTDLVICDLKFPSQEEYWKYCKGSLNSVLSFLSLTERMEIPLWIRHVVVPGLTDSAENIQRIAQLGKQYLNLKKIELLPFKKICISKYQELGIKYQLDQYSECNQKTIRILSQYISNQI